MPKIKFIRTPTVAEGGPVHEFFQGTIHEVSPKSLRRWLDLGCGEEIEEGKGVVPVGIESETVKDIPLSVEVDQEFEAIEAGGEAPPVIVPKLRPGYPRNVSRTMVSPSPPSSTSR